MSGATYGECSLLDDTLPSYPEGRAVCGELFGGEHFGGGLVWAGPVPRRLTRTSVMFRVTRFSTPRLAGSFLSLALLMAQVAAAQQDGLPDVPSNERLLELVQQLGDEEFDQREEAQRRLESFGIDAFDILREAKDDPDIEISRRVRYLLRRLDVVWYQDSDSANVKAILEKYAGLNPLEKATRIDALASLPIDEGIPVLCRIARLEGEDRLSKRAAVALVKAKYFELPADERARLAQKITRVTSQGQRKAIVWLRTFAKALPDPKTIVDDWRKIVVEERGNYANYPATSSNHILLGLIRFETETLLLVDDRDAAAKSAALASELVNSKTHHLLQHVDWLLDRGLPELVVQFAEMHPIPFTDSLGLRYRLAEALRDSGDEAKAGQTAQAALEHRSDDYAAHLEVASQLESRGMHDWAEAEYRFVGEGKDANLIFSFRARVSLSEMLHDQFDDKGASSVLQTVFDEIDKDPQKLEIFRQYRRSENMIRSRMHYFYYMSHPQDDREARKKSLETGFTAYTDDVDLLIAMYRFAESGDDQAYQETARERVSASADRMLEIARRQEEASRDPRQKITTEVVAHYNNQYAWLVANTIGDYDEALRRSRQSVDLMPDASGYWDTLARCYYAKKDYVNAVKFQEHAVSMEPHSGQIQAQLKLFREALAKQQAEAAKAAGGAAEDES